MFILTDGSVVGSPSEITAYCREGQFSLRTDTPMERHDYTAVYEHKENEMSRFIGSQDPNEDGCDEPDFYYALTDDPALKTYGMSRDELKEFMEKAE